MRLGLTRLDRVELKRAKSERENRGDPGAGQIFPNNPIEKEAGILGNLDSTILSVYSTLSDLYSVHSASIPSKPSPSRDPSNFYFRLVADLITPPAFRLV